MVKRISHLSGWIIDIWVQTGHLLHWDSMWGHYRAFQLATGLGSQYYSFLQKMDKKKGAVIKNSNKNAKKKTLLKKNNIDFVSILSLPTLATSKRTKKQSDKNCNDSSLFILNHIFINWNKSVDILCLCLSIQSLPYLE